MKPYPKLTEAEWREIGNQTKRIREELFVLHRMSADKLPVEIVKHIVKTVGDLDSFRNLAEERMFSTKGSDDVRIFYGGITE